MAKPASTTARGYGSKHQKERRRWQIIIDQQGALCTRCHRPITGLWDLDHSDDRTDYLGPAHRTCNRGAGGRKARAKRKVRIRIRSRDW